MKRNIGSKLSSMLLVLALLLTMIASTSTVSASSSKSTAQQHGLVDEIQDGAIFHAFCWSLDAIKDNMQNIANAGFTAVQTSPINRCAGEGTPLKWYGGSADGSQGCWWWHYQPTDWKIGNYQVGSRNDLIEMCNEADKYGIKVIVDVVPNHTTSNTDLVSQDLKNATNNYLYHSTGFEEITDWANRFDSTRKSVCGLADVDTEHPGFQNYFISYLNDCISCGVDGFRYDTAKHIGLPDDDRPSWVTNNFWTRVTSEITDAGRIFSYGEVLQGDNDRIDSYISTIGSATATSYSTNVRNAVNGCNLNVNSILNYNVSNSSDVVTWVESHDNYINDGTFDSIDDTEIKLAWAVLTARKDGAPLFFDRPKYGGPGNKWGINQIGVAGSDLYMDDEIAAVNFFRNYMVGQSEYMSNPNGNNNVLMIERGDSGVVVVNTGYSDFSLNCSTNLLKDGSYQSWTDNNAQYTVSGGNINGTVPARSVAVIVSTDIEKPAALGGSGSGGSSGDPVYGEDGKVEIYYKSNNATQNIHYKVGNGSWTAVPGVEMESCAASGYKYKKIDVGSNILTACFNDGNGNWDNNNNCDYTFEPSRIYTVENGRIINGAPDGIPGGDPGGDSEITIYYYSSWTPAYIHYQIDNGEWTNVPGVQMSNSSIDGYKEINIRIGDGNNLTACFNDGNGNWDNNQGNDYTFNGAGTYTLKNGVVSVGMPS